MPKSCFPRMRAARTASSIAVICDHPRASTPMPILRRAFKDAIRSPEIRERNAPVHCSHGFVNAGPVLMRRTNIRDEARRPLPNQPVDSPKGLRSSSWFHLRRFLRSRGRFVAWSRRTTGRSTTLSVPSGLRTFFNCRSCHLDLVAAMRGRRYRRGFIRITLGSKLNA
jgi:hypothetical protein